MYYIPQREIIMKHINKYLDYTLIRKSIIEMEATQKELTKKKATLRVRIWRLKQIIEHQNQLDLELQAGS